mgnify:CR=1 FL=1
MTKINLNNKTWQWITLIFLSFIWGSSFILMKKGLRSYSHDQVAAFRIFISFIAFLPFGIKYFKKVVVREDVKYTKPHPDGFYLIFDKGIYKKRDYLLVGDSDRDPEAAKAAGIDFFLVKHGA